MVHLQKLHDKYAKDGLLVFAIAVHPKAEKKDGAFAEGTRHHLPGVSGGGFRPRQAVRLRLTGLYR